MYILQVMSSNRHRKRSRSRDSSRQHSNSKKQKPSSRNDISLEMPSTILGTLQDLKYEINSCNKRISSLENRQTPQNVSEDLQEDRSLGIAERDGDTLSVEAGNDLDGSDARFKTSRRRLPAAEIGYSANIFGYSATNFGYSATKFVFSATKFG